MTALSASPSSAERYPGTTRIFIAPLVTAERIWAIAWASLNSFSGLNALLWYLEEVPGLKCTFDTGNFVTHNDDLYAAWAALKDYVTHVHVKDRGTGPVAIGDGNLPCSDILRIISEADTAQYMAIEHYGAPDQLNCILRSASYINSLAL